TDASHAHQHLLVVPVDTERARNPAEGLSGEALDQRALETGDLGGRDTGRSGHVVLLCESGRHSDADQPRHVTPGYRYDHLLIGKTTRRTGRSPRMASRSARSTSGTSSKVEPTAIRRNAAEAIAKALVSGLQPASTATVVSGQMSHDGCPDLRDDSE